MHPIARCLGLETPIQWTVAAGKKPCLLPSQPQTTVDARKLISNKLPDAAELYICTKYLNRINGSTDLAYYRISAELVRRWRDSRCGVALLKRKSHGVWGVGQ